jgi:hypothetical protein
MPERRISSLVITKIAPAASVRVCSFLETDVISIDARLSRLRLPISGVDCCAFPATVRGPRRVPARNAAENILLTRTDDLLFSPQPTTLRLVFGRDASEASPSRPTQRLLGDRGLACTRRLLRSLRPEQRSLPIRTCCFSCRDRNGRIRKWSTAHPGCRKTPWSSNRHGVGSPSRRRKLQMGTVLPWRLVPPPKVHLRLGLDTRSYWQIMRSRSRGVISCSYMRYALGWANGRIHL